MKKLISILLVIALVAGLGVGVVAPKALQPRPRKCS